MKQHRFIIGFVALLLLLTALMAFWLRREHAQVWCSETGMGFALVRGGYRSWSLAYAEGVLWEYGKTYPITATTNGFRNGYHWPRYVHVEIAGRDWSDLTNALEHNKLTP